MDSISPILLYTIALISVKITLAEILVMDRIRNEPNWQRIYAKGITLFCPRGRSIVYMTNINANTFHLTRRERIERIYKDGYLLQPLRR
jgi:hypothetical protein